MQHNMVSITPADYLVPVQPSRSWRSGHESLTHGQMSSSTPFSLQLYACGIHYQ